MTVQTNQEVLAKIKGELLEVLEKNDFMFLEATENVYSIVNLVECKSDILHAIKNLHRIAKKEEIILP